MSAYKPFDPQLHADNDQIAVEAVLGQLEPRTWIQNPDRYGPDLIGEDGTKYLEVEIKHSWKPGTEFPFFRVQLPARKGKWDTLDIRFLVLRSDCQAAIQIPVTSLNPENLRLVRNKYVTNGEMFYSIPMAECTVHQIDKSWRLANA